MNIESSTIAKDKQFKLLPLVAMISVTLLIVSMVFTYHVIEFGPFLTPGGVFSFALIYPIADILAEVYGYNNAKIVIWGNFACVFIFNILSYWFASLPVSAEYAYDKSYQNIFGHSFSILVGYCLSFALSDFVNAYVISKWKVLTRGRYFLIRSIGSSVIGELIFTLIATITIYMNNISDSLLLREFTTTFILKLIITLVVSYPASILVIFLKRVENVDIYDCEIKFNPFKLKQAQR